MTSRTSLICLASLAASIGLLAQQPPGTAGNQTPQQPTEITTRLSSDSGPPRLAVPDFLSLSADKETQEIARSIAEVLWNDLDFEREFYMIPRDTYKSIPAASSIGEPAL